MRRYALALSARTMSLQTVCT